MSANTATAEKATNDETTAKGGVSTKRPTLKKAPGGKTAAKAGTAGAVEAKPGPKAKPATTKPTTTIGLGTDPCSLTNRPRPAWAQAWRAIEGPWPTTAESRWAGPRRSTLSPRACGKWTT